MKKIIFTLEGKRFEVELENSFADYVQHDLVENGIAFDRNNEASKLLKIYLKSLKHNFDTEKQIKILLNNVSL
ncbi:hypothetical protein KKC13_11720 [bacterium]|nr:hypothetical protein [bacterium]MBU1957529.1 hypothetical protein [bacterium]